LRLPASWATLTANGAETVSWVREAGGHNGTDVPRLRAAEANSRAAVDQARAHRLRRAVRRWSDVCGKLASNSGGSASNSNAAPAAAVAPTPAALPPKPIAITAVQLHRAYSDNEVAADARYRGKSLLVDGVVDSIDKNFADDIVLHLRSGDSFNFVMATMKDSQASAAAELKKRQRVEDAL
jgi:hypothetical protein